MKTYICTSGTSILTKSGINIERFQNVPLFRWNDHEDDIVAVRDRVSESLDRLSIPAQLDDTSAEIKSLIKMEINPNDRVILIASDTIDGKLSAELAQTFLTEREICLEVEIKVIRGLQAIDASLFQREGLKNLLAFLVSRGNEDIVLNLTGGFKSVVPYLSLIGMLFNKPVRYIHEDSEDVITLSNLPILMNDNLLLLVEDKLRKIEKETSIQKDEWQAGIDFNDRRFDALIEETRGQVTLSGLGLLFWERFKLDYPEELLRDETDPSEKLNKIIERGIGHHGLEKLRPIAERLIRSPYVRGIPNSCDNQPKSRTWIKPLLAEEAQVHLQRVSESICIVTNIRSDAGYSFLVETTARNMEENRQIAKILQRKFFS
jgi:putative CRISPR-associated protein (TIGR02619 family)